MQSKTNQMPSLEWFIIGENNTDRKTILKFHIPWLLSNHRMWGPLISGSREGLRPSPLPPPPPFLE